MIYIISMGPPSTGGRRRERIIHAMSRQFRRRSARETAQAFCF
jgi:hypothetical protein